jgi:tetratricopeptide (TPR) repeat protein
MTFDVFLYKSGNLIARQKLGTDGRYRFMNLVAGTYEVVVEIENREVARVSRLIAGQYADDVRLDINLAYRSTMPASRHAAEVISIADSYPRKDHNKALHQKSINEIDAKKFAEAVTDLRELLSLDPADYPAWLELGMVYFIRKDYEAAEKCFSTSLNTQPSYFPAALNLGRVRLARKNYQGAIDALTVALKIDWRSASANYFIGESLIKQKRGSLAVRFFEQALALEPQRMVEAHLRLASLYDSAGYKNLAAAQYEQFLKKVPNYKERKKLEQYIVANKSQAKSAKE